MESSEIFFFETVVLDRCGAVAQRIQGEAKRRWFDLGGGVLLPLVLIPAGSFQMGSQHEGGYPDERPVHPVFLPAFWMGQGPVTQAQWLAVMGHRRLPDWRFHGADLPVENITWQQADAFCKHLAQMTGQPFSLPSEAQWEYACRAGTGTPFNVGETLTTDYANYVGDFTFRGEPTGVYRHRPTPAGTFPPNRWGLYEMHGNIWEYCADEWFEDYSGAPADGSPRLHGARGFRAARGGSWHEPPAHCRSAIRLKVAEDDHMEYYGLRVVS